MPWAVGAATIAPVAGVFLYAWLHGRPRLTRGVDALVYVAVPGLVVWWVAPDAWQERDAMPVVAVGLGWGSVTLLERLFRRLASRADDGAILAGMSGMAVHALMEGAAFVPGPRGAPAAAFVWGVVTHRVLVGSVIWWLLRPRHGRVAVGLGAAAVSLATVAGYMAGPQLLGAREGPWVPLYQAFVAGSLLHVVFHQGRHDHDHAREALSDS